MDDSLKPGQRRRNIFLIVLTALVASGGAFAWYFMVGQWYEETDNAYFTGNLVEVSAQIGGTVVWIGPEQNQTVHRGEEILRLADGDELLQLAMTEHELALAVQDVLTLRAEINRLLAVQQLRAVSHDLAEDEFERRQRLFPKNMVSKEELDAARTREAETQVALETARLTLVKARVRAGNQALKDHPRVMAASARVRAAYRSWGKTRVVAPVDGEIAQRRAQAGQQVTRGASLFSIAQRGGAWIEANFKETQLDHIRPGQAVEIISDLYGNDVELKGTVDSIGVGTGSVFSLLPPQNATGNWIKIVQRVPVRIVLQNDFDQSRPLPFGASLSIRVDTQNRSGPLIKQQSQAEPVADADIYDYQEEGVEELITQIIASNQD